MLGVSCPGHSDIEFDAGTGNETEEGKEGESPFDVDGNFRESYGHPHEGGERTTPANWWKILLCLCGQCMWHIGGYY